MDKTKPDYRTWRDIPPMPVCWYPSSLGNPTGGWRTFRPVIHMDKCIHCAVCWESCPDVAIRWVEGSPEVDLEACKGCGICAYECPVKTIEMVLEVKE